MKLTGENRSTRVSLCPPHIPHGVTQDRTRVYTLTLMYKLLLSVFIAPFVSTYATLQILSFFVEA
jgi:hypothetical protein